MSASGGHCQCGEPDLYAACTLLEVRGHVESVDRDGGTARVFGIGLAWLGGGRTRRMRPRRHITETQKGKARVRQQGCGYHVLRLDALPL